MNTLLKYCRLNIMISDMDKAIAFCVDKLGFTSVNGRGDNYEAVQASELIIGLNPSSGKVKYVDNHSIRGTFDEIKLHPRPWINQ